MMIGDLEKEETEIQVYTQGDSSRGWNDASARQGAQVTAKES